MALDTPTRYRNLVLYSVYVRSHGPNGTFADVEADLPRIRDMGVDLVWFMPIHPIGRVMPKGTIGSPYSIADYRAINPEYGAPEDFWRLVETAHRIGLKVMIDAVYNHTAHDSVLVREHPDWYHRDEHGRPVTTVPDWTDVIDLKHPHPELAAYLVETLQEWVRLGVDGFRCDVAPLVPVEFWEEARRAVAEVKPGVIWLAESIHAGWLNRRRADGLRAHSDGEVYRAFDMTYDYDIWPIWQAAVVGAVPVAQYLALLRFQDAIYPLNYVKMRCVENHDTVRIMALAPSRARGLAWTAFAAFNKGAFLIYGGQEAGVAHTPSLFETDKIRWGGYELQPFLATLARLKKDRAQVAGQFTLLSGGPAIQATWYLPGGESLYGVFNTSGEQGSVEVRLPDGVYADVLAEAPVRIRDGRIPLPESAVILRYAAEIDLTPVFSNLLDFQYTAL